MAVSMLIEADADDRKIQETLRGKQEAYTVPEIMDDLDAIARQLGVTPLSRFVQLDVRDLEEIAEAMADEGMDVPPFERPDPAAWHPTSAGLATVRALLQHIDQHPELIETWTETVRTDPDDILTELKGFEETLAWLDARGHRFRFYWS